MKYVIGIIILLLAISANAQWYYGSGEATNLEEVIGFDLNTQKLISGQAADPSSGGYAAGEGSILMRTNGSAYVKTGAADTDWSELSTGSGGGIPTGTATGDMLYFDGSDWIVLARGTAGQVLTQSGQVPDWQDAASSPFPDIELYEDLTAGDPIKLFNDSGTPKITGLTGSGFGTPVQFDTGVVYYADAVYTATRSIFSYEDITTNNPYALVCSSTSGTVSCGTPYQLTSDNSSYTRVTYDASESVAIFGYYKDSGSTLHLKACVVDFEGSTMDSCGSELSTFCNSSGDNLDIQYVESEGATLLACGDNNTDGRAAWVIASGTTLSIGTDVQFNSGDSNYIVAVDHKADNKGVVVYQDSGNSGYCTAIHATKTSTSTMNVSSESVFLTQSCNFVGADYDENAQKIVVSYRNVGTSNHGYASVGSLSSGTFSWGSTKVFNASQLNEFSKVIYNRKNQTCSIYYSKTGGKYLNEIKVQGLSFISIDSDVNVISTQAETPGITYHESDSRLLMSYSAPASYVVSYAPEDRYLFYGVLQETGTAGELKPVAIFGQTSTVHAGVFGLGQSVYVQDDLTLGNTITDYPVGVANSASNCLITNLNNDE